MMGHRGDSYRLNRQGQIVQIGYQKRMRVSLKEEIKVDLKRVNLFGR